MLFTVCATWHSSVAQLNIIIHNTEFAAVKCTLNATARAPSSVRAWRMRAAEASRDPADLQKCDVRKCDDDSHGAQIRKPSSSFMHDNAAYTEIYTHDVCAGQAHVYGLEGSAQKIAPNQIVPD